MSLLSAAVVLALASLTASMSVSSTPAQTFTGFGGSGAWWPNDLFDFPEPVRRNLSDLLFTDAGLGLSSYRYNVGGGGVNVSNPTRAPETFYVSAGEYDWTKDQQGVYFLKAAADRGVPELTMFANSAPAPLTQDGTSCNSQYRSGTADAYGIFLADVAQHFIQEENIRLNHISPMNEPDNNFGPSPCGQEGMIVWPWQRAEVVNGLYDALAARGLEQQVGILADETTAVILATVEYPFWLPFVKDRVEAIVHHTYDFPIDLEYAAYNAVMDTAFPGKPVWMTEVCCSLGNADGSGRGWAQGYDPTINNALMWSMMVLQAFIVGGEPHYSFWTLVTKQLGCSPTEDASCPNNPNSNGWTDGVIYYDPDYASNGNYELYVAKQFWTHKHFGNFVKPGSQRMPLQGPDASNFYLAVQSSDNYYVIALNPDASDATISVLFPQAVCATEAFRTSEFEDFASIDAARADGDGWLLPLGAVSQTTYVFRKGVC